MLSYIFFGAFFVKFPAAKRGF
jgi:hypothetical protein